MFCGKVLGQRPLDRKAASCLRQKNVKLGEGRLDFLLLPMGQEEPPEELAQLKPGGLCLGLRMGSRVRQKAEELGLQPVELSRDPAFKIRNSIPTAEAALALAIGNTEDSLFDSPVLVIGLGAIGSRLCGLLKAMGARVTGAARRPEDLARIVRMGCRAVHTEVLAETARPYRVVFNTVPAPVLTGELLDSLPADTLYLDLASGRGGLGERRPARYVQALGLPGKTAPEAAARILAQTVLEKLEENHAD